MDKMTPQERIDVFAAYVDGAEIEYFEGTGSWEKAYEPNFYNENCVFRVKPAPKTVWINVYDDGVNCVHPTRHAADLSCVPATRIACVEVTYTEGEGL